MIEAGSRRRAIGAVLATLAAGILIGAIVYGIFSTRALSADVKKDIKQNSPVIAAIHAQDARIEALELELKQLLAAQPNLNRKLTADIIRQIEALKFTVRQEGGRVEIVPKPIVVTRTVPVPAPSPTCPKHHCH